ncbi:MAG: hypothetical protein IPK12_05370 [Gemmatimonadetes bacterium]|nr:hypothetical protein [Gemmatimonadota bacterium]
MRRAPPALLLAALASCGTRGGAEAARADVIDTLQAEFLDEGNGCGFVRAAQGAEPQALVTDYVRRDAAGGFLQGSRGWTRRSPAPPACRAGMRAR